MKLLQNIVSTPQLFAYLRARFQLTESVREGGAAIRASLNQ